MGRALGSPCAEAWAAAGGLCGHFPWKGSVASSGKAGVAARTRILLQSGQKESHYLKRKKSGPCPPTLALFD